MGIPCFLITPTSNAKRSLRRFHFAEEDEALCPGTERSYHTASVEIGTFPVVLSGPGILACIDPAEYNGDGRWPVHCGRCGYIFPDEDQWQVNQDLIYTAADGREMTLREAPPGAIWIAAWLGQESYGVNGGTGPVYGIRLPGNHDFMPGLSASNCDRKGEDHDCWCVHGEAPTLTIDKTPEPGRSTCGAGGGSIWANQGKPNEWHGFVTNGELVG